MLFSRSKSRARPSDAPGAYPLSPAVYFNTPTETGVPIFKEKRQRPQSYVAPLRYDPSRGVLYGNSPDQYPYYFVRGPNNYHVVQRPGYNSSQSTYLESRAYSRPRSSTRATARENFAISPNVPDVVRDSPAGYYRSPGDSKGPGILGSLLNAIRWRSKSRPRKPPSSSSLSATAASPRTPGSQSRGRQLYDPRRQSQIPRDVHAEIARRLEKDLRLQDMEDPYRALRRDRSLSLHSTQSRGRSSRKSSNAGSDVQDTSRYSSRASSHVASERPSSTSLTQSSRRLSVPYPTDSQSMMRGPATASSGYPDSRRSSHLPAPKGWFNSRGDQLIGQDTVIRMPKEREYLPCFAHYPPPGRGFADSVGNVIDMEGRVIKRIG